MSEMMIDEETDPVPASGQDIVVAIVSEMCRHYEQRVPIPVNVVEDEDTGGLRCLLDWIPEDRAGIDLVAKNIKDRFGRELVFVLASHEPPTTKGRSLAEPDKPVMHVGRVEVPAHSGVVCLLWFSGAGIVASAVVAQVLAIHLLVNGSGVFPAIGLGVAAVLWSTAWGYAAGRAEVYGVPMLSRRAPKEKDTSGPYTKDDIEGMTGMVEEDMAIVPGFRL
jgi:hypothetical protein